MNFEDRLKATVGAAAEHVTVGATDLDRVIDKGRRYRNRAVAITTGLGVIAGIGVIAASAWVFGALRGAPEPAAPGPAPVSPTTSTTVPMSTTPAIVDTTTSAAPSPVAATPVEPFLVVDDTGVVYVTGDQVQPLVAGDVQGAYPDLSGGFVFQPVAVPGEDSTSIFWIGSGGVAAYIAVPAQLNERLTLRDVVAIDGSPTLLYTIRAWDDPNRALDDFTDADLTTLRETLYLQDLATGDRKAWGEIGVYESGPRLISAGDGLIVYETWREDEHGIEVRTTTSAVADDAFDPDGSNRTDVGCDMSICSPRLSADGALLGYLDRGSLVAVDAVGGEVRAEFSLGSEGTLYDIDHAAALVGLGDELAVFDLETGTSLQIAGLGVVADASFVPGGLNVLLPKPVPVTGFWPVELPDSGTGYGLPTGISLLVTDVSGVYLITSEGIEPVVAGTTIERALSDLAGGLVYGTSDSIVWQTDAGVTTELVANPGGRVDLLTVANVDGQPTVFYLIDLQVRLVRLADLADSLWLEAPQDVAVLALSVSGSTVGFTSTDGRRLVTSFVDTGGDPVEEPFDPEPAEGCHPFDNWCVGDMLLDPTNDTLAYTWVLGVGQDSEVRVVNRDTGETAVVAVPDLVLLYDYFDNYGVASIFPDRSTKIVLIDSIDGTITSLDLPRLEFIRHVAFGR